MSTQGSDSFQPKTVIWRSPKYVDHLGQVLGVLDFDTNFDNSFQRWKLLMEFIEDVLQGIEQGIIPLKKHEKMDLMPDLEAIRKLRKIWNGQCYLRVLKNKEQTKIILRELFYEKPDEVVEVVTTKSGSFIKKNDSVIPEDATVEQYVAEVIPLPKLKNMIPVREIREEVWGIQIREPMALKWAWQGANYGTIVNDGKFTHYLSDGAIPKFEADDMESEILQTYVIHRPVYFAIMDILPEYFRKYYFIFAGNVQKIMTWMNDLDMEGFGDLIDSEIQEDDGL